MRIEHCTGDFCLKRLVARAEELSPSSPMISTLVSSRRSGVLRFFFRHFARGSRILFVEICQDSMFNGLGCYT